MEQEFQTLSGLLGEQDTVCSAAGAERVRSPEQFLSKSISRQADTDSSVSQIWGGVRRLVCLLVGYLAG